MTVYLKVYLLDSTLAFDMLYTYLADEEVPETGGRIRRGMFVVVPFGNGNSRREAIVWEVTGPDDSGNGADAEADKLKKQGKLKSILSVYEDEPLSEDELRLCRSLSEIYACTIGTAVRCIRPLRSKKKAESRQVEVAELNIPADEARTIISETKLKSIFQLKILEELVGDDRTETADTDSLLLRTGSSRVHLKALEKKGYIRLSHREAESRDVIPAVKRGKTEMLSTYSEHKLNPEQEEAFRAVKESIDGEKPEVFLLHGITGSGKTEVYMHLISHVLSEGGDVIMMVPEIALTPQMIAHFTSRFGDNVAVWHSALTPATREREWYRMSRGIAKVAVCTRSGIFSPLKNVRLVIVDEAHDGSYRSEETGLRYNACEVAELRFGGKAAVLYGSATPDVTMYYRAVSGNIRLLTLTERAGQGTVPEMRIVDMRDERSALAHGSLFSYELKEALKNNYDSGKQAMLFVGRRGYSSRMFCRECGRTMICGSCGLPMTYHRSTGQLPRLPFDCARVRECRNGTCRKRAETAVS